MCAAPIPSPRRSAFTMLEMLIVVGVIAILLAIAIPGGIYASNKAKKNSTLSNMEILANAIQQFSDENPLSNDGASKFWYGRLPPDWFSVKDLDLDESLVHGYDINRNLRWDLGEAFNHDDGDLRYTPINVRRILPGIPRESSFRALERTGPGANQMPDLEDPNDDPRSFWRKDYRSIESLHLFISQLSPKGKMILDGLPRQMVTNDDLCGGGSRCPDLLVFDTNRNSSNDTPYNEPGKDKAIDLLEVRDAWGTPLRFQVNLYGLPGTTSPAARYEWEIRSAGPDGMFARGADGSHMFVPEELSGDDVVRKGQ